MKRSTAGSLRTWVPIGALLLLWARPAVSEEWYDAYFKGMGALQRRQADTAIDYFQRAIKSNPVPGENVLTYGTNSIDHYYPYLRLAEAHLMAGEFDAARDALRQSESVGKEPAPARFRIGLAVEAASRRAGVATPPRPPLTQPPVSPAEELPAPAQTSSPQATTETPESPRGSDVEPPTPHEEAHTAAPRGYLEIRTEPVGVSVLEGDRVLGVTPTTIELDPGVYRIALRMTGFDDHSFTASIVAGKHRRQSFVMVARDATTEIAASEKPQPEPAPRSLLIQSQPPGATAYLDDEPIGETDPTSGRLVKKNLTAGSHRLRMSKQGYQDAVEIVEIAAEGQTTVTVGLQDLARSWSTSVSLALAVALGLVLIGGAAAVVFIQRRRRVSERATAGAPAPIATLPLQAAPDMSEPADTVSETIRSAPSETVFGDFRILSVIGKGGMARVLKAEKNGEIVALKRPHASLLEEPEFLKRFLRETDIGRTLHHPNIIRIFERGEVDGLPYFTMELIEGETLKAHLTRLGPLGGRAATKLIVQTAEALDYAHLKGVIHRDLKPSNIMVLRDGTVKVMDYGIARASRFDGLTVTGSFLGTPDYVAPETAEGKPTDGRSDLYSLGVVFYEMLTGKKPFEADTPIATIRKHCSEPPTPPTLLKPGCPPQVEKIILRLLEKSPDQRYQTAEELILDLRDYLNRAG
ncbi:MAG: protein kinase [Acidobacteria bacterium]|nr:protein kinase [Acidobacteriota bacterium]